MVGNEARTSRISPFGLWGENTTKGFSFSPLLRQIKGKIQPALQGEATPSPSEILNYSSFYSTASTNQPEKIAFFEKKGLSLVHYLSCNAWWVQVFPRIWLLALPRAYTVTQYSPIPTASGKPGISSASSMPIFPDTFGIGKYRSPSSTWVTVAQYKYRAVVH